MGDYVWSLEQIRFTLGIFNKTTRNNSSAWRTLGYIADQQRIKSPNPAAKNQDYHQMIQEFCHFTKYINSMGNTIRC